MPNGQGSVAPAVEARPAVTAPRLSAWQRLRRSEALLFLLFILPNVVVLGIFTYWPMLYDGYLSMVRWDMIAPVKVFVGLDNYRAFLHDPTFGKVMFNTFYFTLGAVGGTLLLGLLVALLLNQPLRLRNGARAVVFAPTLLSGAAIGIVWVYVFDPRFGLLAEGLRALHITSPHWLTSTTWAMPAIIIVYVWKNLGFAAVIYLAGLQGISADLYEAARVDGAGPLRSFWSITLPLLSPISFFLVVTSLISSFQAFDIIQVMTKGGPVNATNTLIYYVYQQGFVAFNAGRSAAASMILFILMFSATLIQFRVSERRVHYG